MKIVEGMVSDRLTADRASMDYVLLPKQMHRSLDEKYEEWLTIFFGGGSTESGGWMDECQLVGV